MSSLFVQRIFAAVTVFFCLRSAFGQDTRRPGFHGGAKLSIPLGSTLGGRITSDDPELLKELERYSKLTDLQRGKESARELMKEWDRRRMSAFHSEADYVLIVSVSSTKEVSNDGEVDPTYFAAQESRLEVLSVLKGEDVPTEPRLYHFRYKRVDEGGTRLMANGPILLKLETATEGEVGVARMYLAYLRKEKNGRVVPVSGHRHPISSVFALSTTGDLLAP